MTEESDGGRVDRTVGRISGIVPAALRAEKLMHQASELSALALAAAIAGREAGANTLSAEAAKRRREAAKLMGPYMAPNAGAKRPAADAAGSNETTSGGSA